MAGETINVTTRAVPTSTGTEPGPTPPITARLDRVAWLSFVAATIAALAGYAFTVAPNVTLEFSGIASTGAYYAGVPHPPGYPVWTLYSWCFIKLLPFSNVAWRVAMGSPVASALACGLVAFMVARGGVVLFHFSAAHPSASEVSWLRFVCGVVAGLVLGFSGNVWRSAVVAEMPAISLLLFAAVLCLFFQWLLAPKQKSFLTVAFLLFGLLLTNSQEFIIALPGILGAIMLVAPRIGRDLTLFVLPVAIVATAENQWRLGIGDEGQNDGVQLAVVVMTAAAAVGLVIVGREIGKEWKCASSCGLAFLMGLAFYLYVPIASMSTPPVNWGYPRTVEGFWHVIGRGQYESIHPPLELHRFVGQLWEFLRMSGRQFGWLPLAVSLLPFGFMGWLTHQGRRFLAALAVIGFCVTILMLIQLNPPPDRQAWGWARQYFAAAHAILAVGLGFGLTIVGAKFTGPGRRNCR